jgi:hypothetical protein
VALKEEAKGIPREFALCLLLKSAWAKTSVKTTKTMDEEFAIMHIHRSLSIAKHRRQAWQNKPIRS